MKHYQKDSIILCVSPGVPPTFVGDSVHHPGFGRAAGLGSFRGKDGKGVRLTEKNVTPTARDRQHLRYAGTATCAHRGADGSAPG